MLFHSENLNEIWLVFITKCELENSDNMVTHSIEWWLVSGVRTHRSVKTCLNHLTPHILCYDSPKTDGIPTIA